MKNNKFELQDAELLAVNGGVRIDFDKIKKVAEKINSKNENGTFGWKWGDDWSEDGYWR